jgi:hypothetical protein
MSEYRAKPAASSAGRSNRWTRNSARSGSRHSQNAQKEYERYLAPARAETQAGNTVGAENYYHTPSIIFDRCDQTRRERKRPHSNDNKWL